MPESSPSPDLSRPPSHSSPKIPNGGWVPDELHGPQMLPFSRPLELTVFVSRSQLIYASFRSRPTSSLSVIKTPVASWGPFKRHPCQAAHLPAPPLQYFLASAPPKRPHVLSVTLGPNCQLRLDRARWQWLLPNRHGRYTNKQPQCTTPPSLKPPSAH